MKHVDFFYDFACPYAYLAHHRVDAACARHGAAVTWRPFLLGGVFRAIGTPDRPGDHMSPAKARMNLLDMHRWAAFLGVPFRMPPTHPNRTVLALRAALAAPDLVAASKALFAAYWTDGLDVSQPPVVSAALDRAGFDGPALVAKAEDPAIKDALRRATDDAIAAGVFGAPAFVVTIRDEPGRPDAVELFWGQDRLVLVEAMLAGTSPAPAGNESDNASTPHARTLAGNESDNASTPHARTLAGNESDNASTPLAPGESTSVAAAAASPATDQRAPEEPPPALQFLFDFSSPFAYLASLRVEQIARRAGAPLLYRPFLLGGLFRAIGTANVPLFEMPEPKRRHAAADISRWAAYLGAPYAFPTRFPMNTVNALRMVLALPDDRRAAFVNAVFRAYWAEDRDISDPSVLVAVATAAGLEGPALAARISDEPLKLELRRATEEAARIGVFGAPSFRVGDLLFWGQDRLDFVAKALTGWRPPGE